ncbi:MAG TPA: helix-turn-helix transcriptional regulator [Bacteroidales bacterium]|nr:MAG: antitoxin HipB [Bacteroidetes bacterium ADurb.Bin217]HPM11888.1 helix-turn-helix transcriptional regulator [Bacteroidales bacterium]
MTDLSYKNWISMNDKALTEQIGAYIKHHRVEQNKTQDELAKSAGISRSTLSLLERGETVTLATLIQVLRVLDLLHIMESFRIEQVISPLALAKMEKNKRKRASRKKDGNSNNIDL